MSAAELARMLEEIQAAQAERASEMRKLEDAGDAAWGENLPKWKALFGEYLNDIERVVLAGMPTSDSLN